jgi:hypothetical protein
MTELGEFAMWLAVGAASLGFWSAMSPIFKAIAGRIAGKGADERVVALEQRLMALEDRGLTSGEVETQYARIAELEERLDFTERMLAERTGLVHLPGETVQ